MSAPRFQRLVSHLQRQEDEIRGELADLDRSRQRIVDDLNALRHDVETAAQWGDIGLREQFITFSALCADREQVFHHQLQQLAEQRQATQQRLVALWQRRRSLQTLDQHQQARERARQERREQQDILDGAVRAWYLQESPSAPQEAVKPHALAAAVANDDNEVMW